MANVELFEESLGSVKPPIGSLTGKVPGLAVSVPAFKFGLPIGPRVPMVVDRMTALRLRIGAVLLPVIVLLILPACIVSLLWMIARHVTGQAGSNPAVILGVIAASGCIALGATSLAVLHVPQRPRTAPNGTLHIREIDEMAARAWAAQESGRIRIIN